MRSNTVGQALREKIGLPRSEAAALLKEILGCLERGEPVKLSGFGAFTVRKKRERMGRNLRLVRAPISARRIVMFKLSQILKQRINARRSHR